MRARRVACEWWGYYESTGWGSGGRTEPNTGQVGGGGTGRRDDEALVRRQTKRNCQEYIVSFLRGELVCYDLFSRADLVFLCIYIYIYMYRAHTSVQSV